MAARDIGKAQRRRISSLTHFSLRAICDFATAYGRISTAGASPTSSTETMQMESRFVPLNHNEFFNRIGESCLIARSGYKQSKCDSKQDIKWGGPGRNQAVIAALMR
jgi:hypothetical protein